MDTPVLLIFYVKPLSDSPTVRSVVIREYFSYLTSNVKVLYPTHILSGLLLCKSKRTEEKLLNMHHALADGSMIQLTYLPPHLFQQAKCSIDVPLKQSHAVLQQCLPFLHAAGGKSHVTSDGSISMEGHIFVLNAVHSYLLHKASKQQSTNTPESYNLRNGYLTVQVLNGNLLQQNVDSILIPMNNRYQMHSGISQQVQAHGGTNLSHYLQDLAKRDTRLNEGKIIVYPNREIQIPAKVLILFVVPRLTTSTTTKDKSNINSYQPAYEQMIYQTLQTIDQSGITSLALPVLEPSVKSPLERRPANEMTVRAMVSAFRLFSQNPSIKLKRIIVVDHQVQIRRISKRVKKYQNRLQTKPTGRHQNNSVDFDADDGHSFASVFGVPNVPESASSPDESPEELDSEEYQLPYTDHARS